MTTSVIVFHEVKMLTTFTNNVSQLASNNLSNCPASGLFEDLGFRKHQIDIVRDSNHIARLGFVKTQVDTQPAADNGP
jgi:hypothetical protein